MKSFLKIRCDSFTSLFLRAFPTRLSRIAIFAFLSLPIIYSAVYLYAFWDPYAKLDQVPIAFVNLDQGGEKDGEVKNVGKELEDEIRKNHDLKWDFVSLTEAVNGLLTKKYYSYILVPPDFTQSILSVNGDNPHKAKLILDTREATNVISARIIKVAAQKISETLGHKISEEYFDNIFIDSRKTTDDLKEAVDGAKELSEGLVDAADGSMELKNGLDEASNGGTDLYDGLKDAANGGYELSSNLGTAFEGSTDLKEGMEKLVDGSTALTTNLYSAHQGMQTINTGGQTASTGAKNLVTALTQLSAGSGQISTGLSQSSTGMTALSNGITTLQVESSNLSKPITGIVTLSSSIESQTQASEITIQQIQSELKDLLDSYPDQLTSDGTYLTLTSDVDNLSNQQNDIIKTTGQLTATANNLSCGATGLITGIDKLVTNANTLSTSLATLSQADANLTTQLGVVLTGEQKLASGLDTLVAGQTSMVNGLSQLADGSDQLDTGLQDALDGSDKLNSGLEQLYDGSDTLASGLFSLRDGSHDLKNGLDELDSGSKELADGLSDAGSGSADLYNGLNDGYKISVDKLDESKTNSQKPFLSDPVEFEETIIDPVATYGSGFAPYFIPLALWVGAMAIFLIVATFSYTEAKNYHFYGILLEITRRYLIYCLVGLLQAILLSTVLIKALGLQVNHLSTFYLFTILLAMLSIAIFMLLSYLFGLAGDFIGVIILMLQLTSSGGSYPRETLPIFFQKIGPYLPMTYAVSAFRDIISGSQIDIHFIVNRFVIAIIVLLLLTIFFKWLFSRNYKKISFTLPKIDRFRKKSKTATLDAALESSNKEEEITSENQKEQLTPVVDI